MYHSMIVSTHRIFARLPGYGESAFRPEKALQTMFQSEAHGASQRLVLFLSCILENQVCLSFVAMKLG